MYYVLHRLQSMSRVVIHLGVHNHFIANGKRRKLVEETRLIVEEVDRMLDVKIFLISLSVSKTFLASYLFDDSSNGTMKLFKGEQLKHILDKFCEL